MKYTVDKDGYYGDFGGIFVPEILLPNVEELAASYLPIIESNEFQKEYRDLLRNYVGRPTALTHAKRLSELYGANIFLKREDLCHTGSHKLNNALGQILLAKRLGKTRIIAETGAGQHGVATATICALLDLPCYIFMGETDVQRQKPNVERMRMLGASVVPVTSGSKTLKDSMNEAMRDWINNPEDTYYVVGTTCGPHPYPDMVARFQSIISAEIFLQLPQFAGKSSPDYLVACIGGGSNAAGTFYHYLDVPEVKLIAAEAAGKGIDSGFSAATSILGKPGILHGFKSLVMQSDDGQILEAHSISAGLDYPGIGPLHAHLKETGRAEFLSITDDEAQEGAYLLTRKEGIIPALESAHAIAALKHLPLDKNDIVVVCLSGRGDKDIQTYIDNIH